MMSTMGPVERAASAQKVEVIECETRLYSWVRVGVRVRVRGRM